MYDIIQFLHSTENFRAYTILSIKYVLDLLLIAIALPLLERVPPRLPAIPHLLLQLRDSPTTFCIGCGISHLRSFRNDYDHVAQRDTLTFQRT
jgi:hypothetical protein